jgi:hypothetical protein
MHYKSISQYLPNHAQCPTRIETTTPRRQAPGRQPQAKGFQSGAFCAPDGNAHAPFPIGCDECWPGSAAPMLTGTGAL